VNSETGTDYSLQRCSPVSLSKQAKVSDVYPTSVYTSCPSFTQYNAVMKDKWSYSFTDLIVNATVHRY